MMLKYELTEQPDEAIAPFYEQVGDVYRLKVEGVAPATEVVELKNKLDEFRNGNITLKKQLEQLTKTNLQGVKPDEVNVEQIVHQQVEEMRTNYETQLSALSESKTKLEADLERVLLSDSVKEAALRYGVHESALPDVLNRAKNTFTVKDGVAVPRDKKLDKDGKQYTIDSWLRSLSESASHLFAQSRGSGSHRPLRTGGDPAPSVFGPSRIQAAMASKNK